MLRRTAASRLAFALIFISLSLACRAVHVSDPARLGMSRDGLAKVHVLLEDLAARRRIAGAVALVARDGKIVFLDAVGSADIESRTPMREDTLFRICSMTKPITSAAVMILADEGRLSLDDPVSRFLPEFQSMQVAAAPPRQTEDGAAGTSGETSDAAAIPPTPADFDVIPAARPVTIRDLMTHTSGITYGFFGHDSLRSRYRDAGVSDGLVETSGTMADNVRRLARLPLLHQPGTAWEYGLSTDVLGRIIEVASGLTLDEFFARRIFQPLRMKDSFFIVPRDKRARLAKVYQPGSDGAIEPLPEGANRRGDTVYSASYPLREESQFFSGGAGLVSTAVDYSRFLEMLRRGGELDGVRVLRAESVREMTKNQIGDLSPGFKVHGDGFGLGVGVVTASARGTGLGSVGTFSWGGFYNTYFFVDPAERLTAIVLTQLYPWDHLTLWADFRGLVYASLDG